MTEGVKYQTVHTMTNTQITTPKEGRPTKITDDCVAKLEAALQKGMSITTACEYAEINRTTFWRHMQTDEQFRNKITQARNFVKLLAGNRLVEILEKGSDRDAAPLVKFTLERKEPEEFGAKPTVVVNNQLGYTPPSWYEPQGTVTEGEEVNRQEIGVSGNDE